MTTIAATRQMVAADTRISIGDASYHAGKIYVLDGSIVAGAGDSEAVQRFCDWWLERLTRRLRIPKRLTLEVVVLSPDEGLLVYDNSGLADEVVGEEIAIGTGREVAMAAMVTMRRLRLRPDPRIAVGVACELDQLTGGRAEWAQLGPDGAVTTGVAS